MTKVCNRCKLEKEVDLFNKRSRSNDGYNSYCKECNKLYLKQHYKDNKQYYVNKAQDYKRSVANKIKSIKNVPCADCDIKYPHYIMDFDHKFDKSFNISGAEIYYSFSKILEEIKKCEIVCSNCHRERTHKRLLGNGVTGNTFDFESKE